MCNSYFYQLIKVSGLIISALLLTQCAAPPSKPIDTFNAKQHAVPAWDKHHAALKALDTWQAKGRLAASNGKEGGSAAFDWQQHDHDYQIKFMGAFGAGSAVLTGSPNLITLQDSQGKVKQAKTPEALMKDSVGWHIPLSGLQYWAKGMPIPNQPSPILKVDHAGNLIYLSQLGWDIEYSGYRLEQAIALPGKINLTNNQLKVKLVMKQWHI